VKKNKICFTAFLSFLLLVGCQNISSDSSPLSSTESSIESSTESSSNSSIESSTTVNEYDLTIVNEGGIINGTLNGVDIQINETYTSKFNAGAVLSLSATAPEGLVFKGWNVDEVITTTSTYEATLTDDFYIVGMFEEVSNDYYSVTFGHLFKQSDFKLAGGETDINGLHFNYSAFSFLGAYTTGIQIGSKNNPQTSPWTLTTTFPFEVIVTNITFELCNAASGAGTYIVTLDDYSSQGDFATQTLTEYALNDLNQVTTTFSFSLQAQARAMYFYSLEFSVLVPNNLNLDIYSDSLEADPVLPGKNNIPALNYEPITIEVYYADINFNASKETLLLSLRNLLTNMTKTSYGQAKTMLQYTDESVTNPGFLYGLYDGDLIKATWDNGASWNREHVWACSQMQITSQARPDEDTKNHSTDLQILRVACGPSNGEHGNKFYDNENTSITLFPNITSNLVGHHTYAGDFRGDIARILFYQYTRYAGLKLNDALDVNDNVSMGKLSTLLSWNELDPVDAFEISRNNRIYGYQGNRNPFVDYPDLANKIF
jgi:endonuclease I